MRKVFPIFFLLLGMLFQGCGVLSSINQDPKTRYVEFSGYRWKVKTSSTAVGPGPNYFSDGIDQIWIDEKGQLHMKLLKKTGKWSCTEIISEKAFGHGEYTFHVASRVDQLDPNVVVGLFTWDDSTFLSQANSEIDIEFARWGNTSDSNTLQYSVQPHNNGTYKERFYRPATPFKLNGDYSTHIFRWAENYARFFSYHDHGTEYYIDSWNFDGSSPPREKMENGLTSTPVAIPQPSVSTHVRINLWLYDANKDGIGDGPLAGNSIELLVKQFIFKPL